VPKRVLVTGAAGFIGSATVYALLSRGDEVVGLDNFDGYYDPALKRANLRSAGSRPSSQFELVEGDVRDEALVRRLCSERRLDAIVHLAALAGVRASIGNAKDYFATNVMGSLVLLDAACEHGVGNFVFASSSSVYGGSAVSPFVETDPCDRPLAPYPASKRAVELLGHTYHHLHTLNFTALRFFSVYGPRCRPDLMAHKLLTSLVHGRVIELFGADMRRDFTYVEDIVAGVVSAVDRPLGYELINLGRGEPVLLLDFIQTLEELSGARAQLEAAPKPSADADHTCADIRKASALLDYAPSTSLREGLGRLWAWYCAEQAARD
jgi:UDP-glucuronate 4-epimerase